MTSHSCETTASIYLDYGADSASFAFEDLQICPQGMRLRTRWHFALGTELGVNFQFTCAGDPNGRSRLLKTEGVVVACESASQREGGGYIATVLFLEVTDDILAVIRDLVPAAA